MDDSINSHVKDIFSRICAAPWIFGGGYERGCNLRAEVIATWLQEKENLRAGKIWCWGEGWLEAGDPQEHCSFAFAPSYDPETGSYAIINNFHVAAFGVFPGQSKLGQSKFVFDPVLYDSPVLLESWKNDFVALLGKNMVVRITGSDIHVPRQDVSGITLCSDFRAAADYPQELKRLYKQQSKRASHARIKKFLSAFRCD